MSEKKETVSEVAGLPKRGNPDADDGYYVPDYVMRDFVDIEETVSSTARVSGRRSSAEFLL